MNRDWIIYLIRQEFLDDDWCKSSIDYCIKRSRFIQKSYEQWAVKEILLYMEERKDLNPLSCVREFRSKMDKYSCKNPETSYIFSVAYDTAEAIETFLIVLFIKEGRDV